MYFYQYKSYKSYKSLQELGVGGVYDEFMQTESPPGTRYPD